MSPCISIARPAKTASALAANPAAFWGRSANPHQAASTTPAAMKKIETASTMASCSRASGPASERELPDLRSVTRGASDVEAEMDDVAVLDHVLLALDPQRAGLLAFGLAAVREEVLEADHLGADEAALDVAVDLARGARRERAARHGPRPTLVGPRGQHADQVDQRERRADEAVYGGLGEPDRREELALFRCVEL